MTFTPQSNAEKVMFDSIVFSPRFDPGQVLFVEIFCDACSSDPRGKFPYVRTFSQDPVHDVVKIR